jgi:hypothetical protein
MKSKLNKCPVCGEPRQALSTKCPSCDYEFSDSSAVIISELNQKFDDLRTQGLSKKEYERHQLDIIKNFAIPQVGAEILDLMIYTQPKALEPDSQISAAWRLRQKETIERAKIAFENNPKTMTLIRNYEEQLKKHEKLTFGKLWRKTPFLGKVAVIVVFLFLLLIIIPAKDTSPEAYAIRFNKAIAKENVNKALEYLDECPGMGKMIADDYLTLIDLLIKEERMIEADNLYKSISTYTSASDDNSHIIETKNQLISYYIGKGDVGHAQKYADDVASLSLIIRHYLDNSEYESALALYRKNSTKLVKYDSNQKKRVVLSEDEVVADFIKANTYGLK